MDIKIENLNKSFGNHKVLDNFSHTFTDRTITCIMGPSGSGKTTLTNILMGLMKADSGVITGLRNVKIAAVFQEDRLCEELDAIMNIKLVSPKLSFSRIREAFMAVDLEDYEDKPVSELSGGMRRRVTIIRAMLAKSNFVILDEPFKGLDDELKSKVISFVKNSTSDKTVLAITHDISEANALSAHVVVI